MPSSRLTGWGQPRLALCSSRTGLWTRAREAKEERLGVWEGGCGAAQAAQAAICSTSWPGRHSTPAMAGLGERAEGRLGVGAGIILKPSMVGRVLTRRADPLTHTTSTGVPSHPKNHPQWGKLLSVNRRCTARPPRQRGSRYEREVAGEAGSGPEALGCCCLACSWHTARGALTSWEG